MDMANFVRDNYDKYKNALAANRKIGFLRSMLQTLGVQCTDLQLKNGFYNFLKKYSDVKQKLNSSGFGVDLEKDKSLEKGWILKACPYFDILDEVMGTRPNVSPPCLVSTSVPTPEDTTKSKDPLEISKPGQVNIDMQHDELLDVEDHVEQNEVPHEGSGDARAESVSPDPTSQFVKKALSGIDMKRRDVLSSKSPMGVFAKVMEEKTTVLAKVEQDKLELSQKQFEADQAIAKERNETFEGKLSQPSGDSEADLERERIAERRAEREHEQKLLQMKHDFELQKIQLSKSD